MTLKLAVSRSWLPVPYGANFFSLYAVPYGANFILISKHYTGYCNICHREYVIGHYCNSTTLRYCSLHRISQYCSKPAVIDSNFAPVLSPGELDETYVPSLILVYCTYFLKNNFQAGGHKRWPSLAFVFFGVGVISYYNIYCCGCMFAFCCIRFSFSVLSQEIGWWEFLSQSLGLSSKWHILCQVGLQNLTLIRSLTEFYFFSNRFGLLCPLCLDFTYSILLFQGVPKEAVQQRMVIEGFDPSVLE